MKPVIIIAIAVVLLIPMSTFVQESFALLDTMIRFDSLHSQYTVGEKMFVMGKLIDVEERSITFVEIQVWEDEDFVLYDDSIILGKSTTDARGEFRVPITVEDWDKDGTGEIFIIFEGNEKHSTSSSEIKTIKIKKAYTPLGQEFEYEEIKEREQIGQEKIEQEQDIFEEIEQEAKEIIKNIPVEEIEKQGEVIIENIPSGGGCLIATATYGSELAPQVQQLRELRDNKLLQTESGTSFMESFNDFYYSFSPIIADYERENPVFKEIVKITITPMITSLSVLNYVDMDSEVEVLGYGVSLILLNVGMYFVAPVIVIMIIRKRF